MTNKRETSNYFSILDYTPIGIFILRNDFVVHFWNKSLKDWTGIKKSEIINTSIFGHFPNLKTSMFESRIQLVFEGGPPTIFSSQLHKYIIPVPYDKTNYRIQHTIVTPVRIPGESDYYALFTLQDVTEQTNLIRIHKEAEDELQKHRDNLEELVKEQTIELRETMSQLIQSEKLSALGELIAVVAHELKQPLNGINLISQSLIRDIENKSLDQEDAHEELHKIGDCIKKMSEIIDHMRVYTRFSEGHKMEIIDLYTITKGPFKLLGKQLKDFEIEVIWNIRSKNTEIPGDPIRLEQVFMNLITNAANALENTTKENKKIEITIDEDNSNTLDCSAISVEIKDNAEGIPVDIQDKLFEPFFTTSKPGKGTGLGLSISKKIIEYHNGIIELESGTDKGTVFRVTLPRE